MLGGDLEGAALRGVTLVAEASLVGVGESLLDCKAIDL